MPRRPAPAAAPESARPPGSWPRATSAQPAQPRASPSAPRRLSLARAAAVDRVGQEVDLLAVRGEQDLVAGQVAGRAAGRVARPHDRIVEPGEPIAGARTGL